MQPIVSWPNFFSEAKVNFLPDTCKSAVMHLIVIWMLVYVLELLILCS